MTAMIRASTKIILRNKNTPYTEVTVTFALVVDAPNTEKNPKKALVRYPSAYLLKVTKVRESALVPPITLLLMIKPKPARARPPAAVMIQLTGSFPRRSNSITMNAAAAGNSPHIHT